MNADVWRSNLQFMQEETREAALVIENSDRFGPFLYTAVPTPATHRFHFRDRSFSKSELHQMAAKITIEDGRK